MITNLRVDPLQISTVAVELINPLRHAGLAPRLQLSRPLAPPGVGLVLAEQRLRGERGASTQS